MSANTSDSDQLTDWTLVDKDGKIQEGESGSESASSDFVTLEAETGAVEYHKPRERDEDDGDDDVDILVEHQTDQTEQIQSLELADGEAKSGEAEPDIGHATQETCIKEPIKHFEIPAEETASVDYVEGKNVDEEQSVEQAEVVEEDIDIAVEETDNNHTEDREVEELTVKLIAGSDGLDGATDNGHVEEVLPCPQIEEHDQIEHAEGAVAAASYRIPLTLIPKHCSEDSCSSSDSDFVRIDPSTIPDELDCVSCRATEPLTSSTCTTCTSVSPASSLSNFSFLPLPVEGGDDPCDRPDSPDTLNGYDSDSDVSVIEDYDSQSMLDDLAPEASKPVVRRYRHYRDDGLNNKLNWILILVVTAGIALGIGHFIGSSNEYHHKKKIQEGQIQRLKSLQNELLSCLEKDEEWGKSLDGNEQTDQDNYLYSTCSVRAKEAASSLDQSSEPVTDGQDGTENDQPDQAEFGSAHTIDNLEESFQEYVSIHQEENMPVQESEDATAVERESVSSETETTIPEQPVSHQLEDNINVEVMAETDQLHASGDQLNHDNIVEIQELGSRTQEENLDSFSENKVTNEGTGNSDSLSESDIDSGNSMEESTQPLVEDHSYDQDSSNIDQDTTTQFEEHTESTVDEHVYVNPGLNDDISEYVRIEVEDDITESVDMADAGEDTAEDLDTADDESEVNISLVVSCQKRVEELSEDLSFAQGRAEMWKRLFVNERENKESTGHSDDPALSFFTCVNMFLPAINVSEAMKPIRKTPLADFSETVAKLYRDGGNAVKDLSETIQDQWSKVNDFVQSEQFQSYINSSKEVVTSLNNMLKVKLDEAKNMTKSEEFAAFTKKTTSAWSRVSEKLSSKWQEFKTYTTSEDFKSKVTEVGKSIQKTWQSVQNYSNKILHGDDTSSTLGSVTDSIKRTVDSTWQGVKETVGHVLQKGKKRHKHHHQKGERRDKDKKHKKKWLGTIKLPGEERAPLEDKIYDKETGEYRYKTSRKVWIENMKKARAEAPAVVDGEYRPGRVKKRKFLKKIKLPGEERDSESWFDFWSDSDSNSQDKHGSDEQIPEANEVPRKKHKRNKEDSERKDGCRKNKCSKHHKGKDKKERIRKDEVRDSWETFEEDYDIQCRGNKQCIDKQVEDARKLYVELLHYRQWLKDRHYKKDMKELEEFLSDLEEFMDDPHPDDKDLEELQEDFEEVLEDMEKRAKKHNRKQQKEREQQEKELENIRQKSDKERKKESMEEEEDVKDEKKRGFGHKKKRDNNGHAKTKRREFHQETVVKPALNDPSYERQKRTGNQENMPYSTTEDSDADWFFRRAEDREEQRWHLPTWQEDADPFDNWFFHRAQGRSDDRTGITMWDMYNWFLERYEHRQEWRSYNMDDQSNWFLRRP
ncbi:uro-adherence factor A-like isoform X2 [Ptychodera flava]|uniref:uro-adherence factor A-like isoform X2 n=1 Tax=Ptychodera flava TaxID=63121 RepID=UPI00396A0DCC